MFGLDLGKLKQISKDLNLPAYRAGQIRDWIYKKHAKSFNDMSNLPKDVREDLTANYSITKSAVERVSRDSDTTSKLLVAYPDGCKVEAVVMNYREWSTACLSTQVGCAMACTFCASGPLGSMRNLTAEEMAEELWHCAALSAREGLPLRNIVLMGVGEPLANLKNVVEFIRLANDPHLFDIGQRRITLSTVGLVPAINLLAREDLAITLAISLHAPSDQLRNTLIPINRQHPLKELLAACRSYTDVTGRRVTYEYLLLAGINDAPEHARQLAALLKGHNCLVNLIPYNPVEGLKFRPSRQVGQFKKILEDLKINVTVRRSLGGGIDAACGQLRRREADKQGG